MEVFRHVITSFTLQLITFLVNHKFCQLRKTWDVKTIDNDFLMLVLEFTHQDKERLKGVCQNVSNHNNDKSWLFIYHYECLFITFELHCSSESKQYKNNNKYKILLIILPLLSVNKMMQLKAKLLDMMPQNWIIQQYYLQW